ncbi:hypothetical protein LZP81_25550 [Streptomyces parvulus]|uniref:hypothetical protein n=1 Tax=Streptomyces TaxID=1883 RepID=UPI001CFB2E7E|nr:hypothetical protein [Streptomyces parvulus]MCC9157918.1 hypothetical protein [Streptomyces parvulus]MCE7690226.1 hypothetical protein [Streptomyces parvulus]
MTNIDVVDPHPVDAARDRLATIGGSTPARAGVLPGGLLLDCLGVTARQASEPDRVSCRAASPSV